MQKVRVYMYRIVAAIVSISLCLPITGCVSEQDITTINKPWYESYSKGDVLPSSDDYQQVARKGNFALSVKAKTGEIMVENTVTGMRFYSNPPSAEEDVVAVGYNKLCLASQLIVSTISANRVVDETNSKIACANKGGLKVYPIPEGILCEYAFVDEKITIPVSYTLTEQGLQASVLTGNIIEEGDLKLVSVSLLPYFGAVEPKASGYLLIPDGCGALLELSDGLDDLSKFFYDKDVYGRDITYNTKKMTSIQQDILVPAFGLKSENRALLGVITEGAACSTLKVNAEGRQSSYSSVYPTLSYRRVDNVYLREEKFDEKQMTVYSKKPYSSPRYTVEYRFLEGENATYSGMAYETALLYKTNSNASQGTQPGLWVETIGSVKKPDNVLGVPVDTVISVTDFSEATQILNELSANELPVNLLYYGIYKGGLYDAMPVNAMIEKKLEKASSFAELLAQAEKLSATVYPMVDLLSIYKSGHGISYRMDAVRDTNGGLKEVYAFQPSTQTKDKEEAIRTILKSQKLGPVYQGFLQSFKKSGAVAMGDSGLQYLTADYHRGREVDRQQAMVHQQEAANAAAETLDSYLVEKAGAYLFNEATAISSVPLQSSQIKGLYRDVPFYQLVAGQFAQLVASPCNLQSNMDSYILKAIEFGTMPSILLMDEQPSVLEDTEANWAFTGNYSASADQVKKLTEMVKQAFGPVQGAQFVSHNQISAGVAISEYSNGVRIAVNYTDKAVLLNEAEVPSMGFMLIS